jgi:tetratricopeptide (TPR) repeat protein
MDKRKIIIGNKERFWRNRAFRKAIKMKKRTSLLILILISGIIVFSCEKRIAPAAISGEKIMSYDSSAFDYVFVEAIKQKLLGNSGDALKYLEQCLKINSESDAAYFQMAQIALSLGDENKGKEYALKAYSINNKNYWYLIMLAGTYYKERNIDSTIIFYEKAAKEFPDKEDLKLTLGNLYSEGNKFEKAQAIFESLDKKYGVNEGSTVASVKNLMRAEKYDEAEVKTKELLAKFPDEVLYNGLMAEILRGKGENSKAMEVYNKLIERNPNNPETQLSLCDFLISEKRYEELMLLLNKVIINEEVSREDKISLIARLIQIPDIIKIYGNRLQVSLMVLESDYINDPVILLLRPELFIAGGKLTEATNRLEEIIEINPENYYAWEKLLLVYFQAGDFKNLEAKGEECASKFNRSFLAKLLYATAATENKNFNIALEELRKANILAGEDKELLLQVLSTRADVYYRMKEYDKAFETFDEALKNTNKDLTILNNYAYYLAEQGVRLKEAEIMAKKVVETEKTNATFLDTYGWVLYKRGKLKEAAKVMESIITYGGKPDAVWYEHYGFILKKQKECKEAIINWNKALKIDSTKLNLLKEIENCKN